jgi:hypothetical protein
MMRPLPNSDPTGPTGSKSPSCRISSYSSTRRHSHGAPQQARCGWVFSRDPWVAEKDNSPLLLLVHFDDLKYDDLFCCSFNDFFQGFLVWVFSLTVKVRLLEGYLMLQSRKMTDNSRIRCSWIHETRLKFTKINLLIEQNRDFTARRKDKGEPRILFPSDFCERSIWLYQMSEECIDEKDSDQ